MFEKVLIAEDWESSSISVRKTLEDLGIEKPVYVSYCDHAVTQIRKAIQESEPFDLLITDLSFDADGNIQKINDGPTLIQAVKELQSDLKVVVFSVEGRLSVANKLKRELEIDGYVPKGRGDSQDLKAAIQAIAQNRKHISSRLERDINDSNHDFTDRDIAIIKLIANGTPLKNIPFCLEQQNIIFKLSSVEKRLNHIKTMLDIANNIQLIAYCKDQKMI